jgi:hypothetical protein
MAKPKAAPDQSGCNCNMTFGRHINALAVGIGQRAIVRHPRDGRPVFHKTDDEIAAA